MKRTLIVLPLLALIVGLAVFFLRRPESIDAPPKDPGTGPAPSLASPALPDAPKGPSGTAPTDAPAGSLRFIVTLRGKPAGPVDIIVMQSGIDKHAKFKTEADGTQWLRGLPPGEYAYSIEAEGAIVHSGDTRIAAGQNVTVTVDLKAGGRIHGTVTDRAGRPIPDTRVFLLDEINKAPRSGTAVVSDKEGKYALKSVPPGAFGVRFRHTSYKPLDRMGMIFRDGNDEYKIDATLDAGATISGRVVDEQNMPIESAELIAGNGDSAGIAKSGADGAFTVTGLTDAPANLSAAKPGYGKVVLRNLAGNPTGVVLRLPKAGTLLGRLQIDKIPPQTQITLSRFDDDLRQVIPADSRFFALPTTATFAFDDLTPGTYWVEVKVEGYEAVDRPQVVVGPGQTTVPVTISMRKKN